MALDSQKRAYIKYLVFLIKVRINLIPPYLRPMFFCTNEVVSDYWTYPGIFILHIKHVNSFRVNGFHGCS